MLQAGKSAALAAAFLAATTPYVKAGPAVNVAVQTSFDAPPFLLELL